MTDAIATLRNLALLGLLVGLTLGGPTPAIATGTTDDCEPDGPGCELCTTDDPECMVRWCGSSPEIICEKET
jgi:hypothetical protein